VDWGGKKSKLRVRLSGYTGGRLGDLPESVQKKSKQKTKVAGDLNVTKVIVIWEKDPVRTRQKANQPAGRRRDWAPRR